MKTTRNIAFIALFTAILCILSPLSIPLGTLVPISLATLAVYIIGALLDFKRAPICVILYIIIGMMGMPVFSGFEGGIAKLIGPTGGFIFGYILGVFAESLLISWKKDKIYIYPIAMVVATLFIYLFGCIWFMVYFVQAGNPKDFSAVMMSCVVPFLLGDSIKIVVATLASFKLRKPLDRALSVPERKKSATN